MYSPSLRGPLCDFDFFFPLRRRRRRVRRWAPSRLPCPPSTPFPIPFPTPFPTPPSTPSSTSSRGVHSPDDMSSSSAELSASSTSTSPSCPAPSMLSAPIVLSKLPSRSSRVRRSNTGLAPPRRGSVLCMSPPAPFSPTAAVFAVGGSGRPGPVDACAFPSSGGDACAAVSNAFCNCAWRLRVASSAGYEPSIPSTSLPPTPRSPPPPRSPLPRLPSRSPDTMGADAGRSIGWSNNGLSGGCAGEGCAGGWG